ncbi:MAG: glutamate--tRNA ligase family protein, partial [Patescibacteria group bacterium]
MSNKVVTRFPPSPTGFLHIGGVRTALFNYLFAAHNGGKMFLRFEDTDKERSKPEFEKDILDAVNWAGIPYEMPAIARQSERNEIYKKYFATLVEKGLAYEAEPGENNPDKKVIRFKNPNTTITFTDNVRGQVTFDTADLGDFVIARSMDEPLYHLAVVIDDHEMGVTHVIRGEEHISNTPRQILILEALGFTRPEYAHIPLILAPDKTKLSKRHGAVSATEYRTQGYIPEAIVNYLALLGWNPGGEKELFTLAELAELFTLDRVHKAGAVFDIEKLKWFNHEHLKKLSDAEYKKRLEEFASHPIDGRLVP